MPRGMSAKDIAKQIATSPETEAFLLGVAREIAAEATSAADALVGGEHKEGAEFGVDSQVLTRAKAYIWAKNGAAIHAERKAAVLVAAASQHGKGRTGRRSKPKGNAK